MNKQAEASGRTAAMYTVAHTHESRVTHVSHVRLTSVIHVTHMCHMSHMSHMSHTCHTCHTCHHVRRHTQGHVSPVRPRALRCRPHLLECWRPLDARAHGARLGEGHGGGRGCSEVFGERWGALMTLALLLAPAPSSNCSSNTRVVTFTTPAVALAQKCVCACASGQCQ